MKYASEKSLRKAVKEGNYGWLGRQFFNAFCLLKKSSKVRKYHVRVWNSMTKSQQDACE